MCYGNITALFGMKNSSLKSMDLACSIWFSIRANKGVTTTVTPVGSDAHGSWKHSDFPARVLMLSLDNIDH